MPGEMAFTRTRHNISKLVFSSQPRALVRLTVELCKLGSHDSHHVVHSGLGRLVARNELVIVHTGRAAEKDDAASSFALCSSSAQKTNEVSSQIVRSHNVQAERVLPVLVRGGQSRRLKLA